MPRALITLTTDFGYQDHFVGVMKGVIKTIAPTADIVDITHGLTPFQVSEAAFVLSQFYSCFPKKTVHVVVVDPGVGSARRPILAQGGGYSFIAPDNGALSIVLERENCAVRELTAERYFLKPVSQTFHGRDVFAPIAAHVAKGLAVSRLGKRIQDALRLNLLSVHQMSKRAWAGTILKIDRFGNLITNLSAEQFGWLSGHAFELQVGMERISRVVSHYAEAQFGEPVLILGSSGYFEVSIRQANAAAALGVGVGAPVELTGL